jgi:YD repeat-containing protein
MKKFIFSILILQLWITGLIPAQNVFDDLRKLPLLTPQAASFAKYVEFPINMYNGIPEISIPLYTIKSGDISIPITLTYHAGGIKVAEEASTVGLGWNLQVGGVISKQINGRDDDGDVANYIGKILPCGYSVTYDESYGAETRENACNACDNKGTNLSTYSINTIEDITLSSEGEPDIYMYNFGGYTGKFFKTGYNPEDIHDLNKSNIKFMLTYDEKITAVTPDGFIYDFSMNERGNAVSTNTSYYLTSITSPTGKKVTFEYESLSLEPQLPTRSEVFKGTYCGTSSIHTSTPHFLETTPILLHSNMVYLKKITFDEGYLEFTNNGRQDSYGYKLDDITIYYKDGTLFKSFTFNQSYFSGNYARHYLEGQTSSSPYYYPVTYLSKRLRLNSVTEQSGSESPLTHQFEYYEGGDYTLPYKSSYAVDYWGYYNGNTGNTGFIPAGAAKSIGSSISEIANYSGSNRFANETYAKSWMLKRIIYPTKGWTEYEYSLHKDLENFAAPLQTRNVTLATETDDRSESGVQEGFFTIYQSKNININVSLLCDCYNTCYCNVPSSVWDCGVLEYAGGGFFNFDNNILYAALFKLNPSTGNYEVYKTSTESPTNYVWDMSDILPCTEIGNVGNFEKKIILEAGTYKIVVNYPDNKKIKEFGIAQMSVWSDETYSPTPEGGGLRATKITHYDPVSNTTLSKSYSYTGGTIMSFPKFAWQQQYTYEDYDLEGYPVLSTCTNEYLYSYSITPYSPSSNGNTIGYTTVTETLEGGEQGKTVYTYYNQPDGGSSTPGVPSTTHLYNGFLSEIDVYDKDDNLVKKTVNTPEVGCGETFWAFKGDLHTNYTGGIAMTEPTACSPITAQNFTYNFYPIQSGKIVQQQSMEQEFVNTSHILQTTHDYEYTGQALLKTDRTTKSNNKVFVTEYKYPKDYSASESWINDMQQKNMITKPLEIMSKVDDKSFSGSFIKYKTTDGLTTPNEIYKIETSVPKIIASTAPSAVIPNDFKLDGTINYDANGNIISTQLTNNITTLYIWGYNNVHPVVKIEGKAITDIDESIKTAIQTHPFTGATSTDISWLKTQLSSLINDKTCMVTFYTYAPLIGMTSSTDPNGVTTYYEYDSFGRLKCIKDDTGRILKTYEYHYKQ